MSFETYVKRFIPKHSIYFYDLETERGLEGSVIYVYVVRTDENYNILGEKEFYSIEEFLEFIKTHKGIYIAHNSGGFDFLKMLYALKDYIDSELSIVKHGKFLRAVLKYELTGRAFIDSLAVIPMALRKFKKAFGLKEGKGSFEGIGYIISYQLTEKDWKNLKEYCKQDVYTLIDGYKKFEEILMEKFGMKKKLFLYPTLSSISFSILREKSPVKLKKVELSRQVYAGGRTEIFKLYGENLYYIDINSSYPYVMSNFEYPVGKFHKTNDMEEEGVGFAKILHSPDLYIPPLFAKAHKGSNKKLLFINYKEGDIILSTNLELRYLEKLGYEIEYIGGIGTSEMGKPFEYLKDFYEERKKNKDEAMRTTIKLLMNSAYGKFGQRQIVDVFTPNTIGRRVVNIFSNVIIASYITARARLHLYEAMRKCGLENIYYTDTDSIISKRIDEDLIGNELGKWKLEHKIERYYAIQPKVYFLETKEGIITKAKGFGKIKADDFDDFIFKLENGIMKTNMVGVSTIIRENMGETFYGTRRIKKLTSQYTKRKILQDGIETRAFYSYELLDDGYSLKNLFMKEQKAKQYAKNLEAEAGKWFKN